MKTLTVGTLLCLLGGCSSQASAPWTAASDAAIPAKDAATGHHESADTTSTARTTLQWKRAGAFEADLSRALDLPRDSLCREFGTASCVHDVHLVPLGGSDPFSTGMFEPAAEPLASTPTVVERIVLSACAARVELDRKAGSEASVFKQLSLDGDAPAPEHEETRALVTELFQRLLARDPGNAELATVAALARDDSGAAIAASDFAKLACFTIGSSAEFLFF
jgi:hypothetical protein